MINILSHEHNVISFCYFYIFIKSNIILVNDNEPRNIHITKQIKRYIDNGFNICLFPESFPGKDINEAILKGMSKPEIQRIISNNTFNGLRAIMEFNKWKKC